jgi:small multidrug resistance pump
MAGKTVAVIVTIAFSLLGVLGDYFLKVASADERWLRNPAFHVGFVVYASTAFGWLFVMKHLKLGTIAVLYSMTIVGLMLASLVLLVRFA